MKLEHKREKNVNLPEDNKFALKKCIDQLEIGFRANERHLQEIRARLQSPEAITVATDFKNSVSNHDADLEAMHSKMQELQNQLQEMLVKQENMKTERDTHAQKLDAIEGEKINLLEKKQHALRRVANLETEMKANKPNVHSMNGRSERILFAVQPKNSNTPRPNNHFHFN